LKRQKLDWLLSGAGGMMESNWKRTQSLFLVDKIVPRDITFAQLCKFTKMCLLITNKFYGMKQNGIHQ
jgi:hypothetical protein